MSERASRAGRLLIALPVRVVVVVAALAALGLTAWWFLDTRLPDQLTVDTDVGQRGEPGSVSNWVATGDRLDDRRLLRDAYRAWVDGRENSMESDSGILPGPSSERTEVRVVFAGDVADWRRVVMVMEDGKAAALYSERRAGDRRRALRAWGDEFPSRGTVPPVVSLGGRPPTYLLHPDVTRLEVTVPNEVAVTDGEGRESLDVQGVRWVDAPLEHGLATPDPGDWRGECGRPVLRAHLSGGDTVAMLAGGGRNVLPLEPEHVSTPAKVMTLAHVACQLPESQVYRLTVEELWSGELPGIDDVRGEATALWVRAETFGGHYADGDATDYGVLVYATDQREPTPHVIARRPSHASVQPQLIAGLISGGSSEASYYVAIGNEVVERIELVGPGGTQAPGRVVVVPIEREKASSLTAVGFGDNQALAALEEGPMQFVYR